MSTPAFEPTDEELMSRLAGGSEDALGPLYGRYASAIVGLASRSLEHDAAEEIAQDVLLTVWRKASVFDPARGTFRAWVFQIAHFRILNELRRRSSQPPIAPDLDGERLQRVPDRSPEPAEAAWRAYRRAALESAFRELPPAQREALGLALLGGRSHAEIAEELHVPLGTAKTRIRVAMERLRGMPSLVAAFALAVLASTTGSLYVGADRAVARDERALRLLTASDLEPVRLTAAPGVSEEAHGHFRCREGLATAVLALTRLPAPPRGQVLQAWLRDGDAWVSLGIARLDAAGNGWIVAERPEIATASGGVEVTLEPEGGSAAPTGPVIVRCGKVR
ncbi:MAG TPA: sigma-70 family RNA polymerase sigma factor [Planctomycetota bacterium]|nr:sigma-70 family RNA polymerase sigma factor [Planctomycetota bacterium]